MRLKLVRDGLGDFEYLRMLAALRGRDATLSAMSRVATSMYNWTADPTVLLETKVAIGEAIEKALDEGGAPRTAKSDDDAQQQRLKAFRALKQRLHLMTEAETAASIASFPRRKAPPQRQHKIDHFVVLFAENRA